MVQYQLEDKPTEAEAAAGAVDPNGDTPNGRPEEDILTRSGDTITLGGKPYEVKPLVIAKSRAWRKKFATIIAKINREASAINEMDQGGEFSDVIEQMMANVPDEFLDLFFSWCSDLDRDEIEQQATEAEVAHGLAVIFGMAFPFVRTLETAMAAVEGGGHPA